MTIETIIVILFVLVLFAYISASNITFSPAQMPLYYGNPNQLPPRAVPSAVY